MARRAVKRTRVSKTLSASPTTPAAVSAALSEVSTDGTMVIHPTKNFAKKADDSVDSKKLKILSAYITESPFPSFPHPTHAEARHVHDILSDSHSEVSRKMLTPSSAPNSAQTCGKSLNVIDSLIGVILSQNTSGRNSTSAKRSLDSVFGVHNFSAIAESPSTNIVNAIRHGGMANKKAAIIQNLLRSIKERHGEYSLQHLLSSTVSNEEAMKELISYDGVGPKSASCVLLFCLGRESFAVDTHIFRLSKVLGWLPEKVKNDRVKAQAHLDLRIPDDLKYGLHVLMIKHGRACKGCRSGGRGDCILKEARKSLNNVKGGTLD